MNIVRAGEATVVDKPEGTRVSYYMFDDYEVINNELAPHAIQQWHHHETIGETMFVIEGSLEVLWRENGEEKSEFLGPGDLAESEHSPHTLRNSSDQAVRFVVIKRVPSGQNHRQTFKEDKVLD